jgi:hypothetical protein
MTSNVDNATDFIGATHRLHEIFLLMRRLNVPDSAWSRLLSDPAYAAHVAKAMLYQDIAGSAFQELCRRAQLDYVDPWYRPEHAGEWTRFGDRVSGRFHVLQMDGEYSESEALSEVAKVRGRRVADAWTLAAYACAPEGWDGVTTLVAFGSYHRVIGGKPSVPVLTGATHGSGRGLSLLPSCIFFPASTHVLCVMDEDPA